MKRTRKEREEYADTGTALTGVQSQTRTKSVRASLKKKISPTKKGGHVLVRFREDLEREVFHV